MMIVCDEFMFFNPAALPAILPTLATGAVFVMISSVSPDGDSPIVRLLDTCYEDGTPVVRKLNWVQACKDCQRKGIADRCTHIARPPQHFQSYGSQARLSRLMSHNQEANDRENLNIGGKPSISAAFERAWIDATVARPFQLTRTVHHIFVTIDPSAGKDRNYYAVMSTIFVDGICVVCLRSLRSLRGLFRSLFHLLSLLPVRFEGFTGQ